MNDRYAEVSFDDGCWHVVLHESSDPRAPSKAEQEFARFDDPTLQLYIYRWCYEGVVCL